MKLTKKGTDINQANFYEKQMYLHCLHYRTTD